MMHILQPKGIMTVLSVILFILYKPSKLRVIVVMGKL